eukprot:95506-Rhodomonas_salina.3
MMPGAGSEVALPRSDAVLPEGFKGPLHSTRLLCHVRYWLRNARYGGSACYEMSAPDVAYGGAKGDCERGLANGSLAQNGTVQVRLAIALCTRYGMSGTDVAYVGGAADIQAGTGPLPTWYGPRPSAVLRYGMVVPGGAGQRYWLLLPYNGTILPMVLRNPYAVPGTDMRLPGGPPRAGPGTLLLAIVLGNVRRRPMGSSGPCLVRSGLRACYAMPGTDPAYAATRLVAAVRSVQLPGSSRVLCGP